MAYGDVINMPSKRSGVPITARRVEHGFDIIAGGSILFSLDDPAPGINYSHYCYRLAQLAESSRNAGYQQALADIRAQLGIQS